MSGRTTIDYDAWAEKYDQTRGVSRAVVPVDVGVFEVPLREVPVQVERAKEALAEAAVRPGAARMEDVEEPSPG